MSKVVEIRRHTDNDGDVLTDDGIEAALALGAHLADVEYAIVVSTGAQRATQTAANIVAGGGLRVPRGVIVEPSLRSTDEARWKAAYGAAGSGHLDKLRQADPEFVASETRVLGDALRRVAARLSDGERALVIGHSPTNEAAIHGLAGATVDPMGKGAGVVLTSRDEQWEIENASMP